MSYKRKRLLKPEIQQNLKKLGNRIKELREKQGLSLRQMSAYCDTLDYSDIAKIEKGKIDVRLLTILQLAKALEVPATELMNFDVG